MSDLSDVNSVTAIIYAVGSIAVWFGGKYLVYRLAIRRDNRNAYKTAYKVFRSIFTDTLQQLETGDTTLNVLILQDFPKHDAAFKEFYPSFKFLRKRRIYKKWHEYENMYYELKNIQMPFALAMAIPPPGESIMNPTPEVTQQWENIRADKLYNIIHDLLKLTIKNRWF